MSGTAAIFTLYHGTPGAAGPMPLNTYPANLATATPLIGHDPFGYLVAACGSYVMAKLSQAGMRTPQSSVMGVPPNWPTAAPNWVASAPVPGGVAVRPSVNGDNGHALIVEAVMPSGFTLPDGTVLPDGSILASSYNSFEDGAYALQYWAPTGELNGVEFALQWMNFPQGYQS